MTININDNKYFHSERSLYSLQHIHMGFLIDSVPQVVLRISDIFLLNDKSNIDEENDDRKDPRFVLHIVTPCSVCAVPQC